MMNVRLTDLYETIEAGTESTASDLYVVDADLRLALVGSSLADLLPADAADALPADVASVLAVAMHDHSFEREPIARFATAGGRQLRAARLPGAHRAFYAVIVRDGKA